MKLDRAVLIALAVTGLAVQGCSVARLALQGSVQERLIAAERNVMPAVVHVKPIKEIYLAGERR